MQVCIIFAVVNNFLKDVPVNKVKDYEKSLFFEMNGYHKDLLDYIAGGGSLDDEHKKALSDAVSEFSEKYAAGLK